MRERAGRHDSLVGPERHLRGVFGRGARAAESARLESVCGATHRGFESHSLRQPRPAHRRCPPAPRPATRSRVERLSAASWSGSRGRSDVTRLRRWIPPRDGGGHHPRLLRVSGPECTGERRLGLVAGARPRRPGGRGVVRRGARESQGAHAGQGAGPGAGAPVSVSMLADVLWPDGSPGRPGDQISVLVSRLRKVLGADRLVRSEGGFALRVDWLDVDELGALVGEAADALGGGRYAAARAAAGAALTLARGAVLPEDEGPWLEVDRASAAATVIRASWAHRDRGAAGR